MILGVNATCDWIASDFNLDWGTNWNNESMSVAALGLHPPSLTEGGYGWKVLEITWLSTQGNIIWVDTLLWLSFACALFLMHHVVAIDSAKIEHRIPKFFHIISFFSVGVSFFSGGVSIHSFIVDTLKLLYSSN